MLHQHHPKAFGQRKMRFLGLHLSFVFSSRGSTNFIVFLSNRIYPVFVHSVGFLKISKIPSSGGWVSFGHFPIFVSCSRHGGDSRSVQGLLAEGVLEGKRLKR